METPSETPDAPPETPAAEPEAPPATPAEESPARPGSFFKLERGDLLPFCILIGFSAWLWSHASNSLGGAAPFVGALIGLAVAYIVRTFC